MLVRPLDSFEEMPSGVQMLLFRRSASLRTSLFGRVDLRYSDSLRRGYVPFRYISRNTDLDRAGGAPYFRHSFNFVSDTTRWVPHSACLEAVTKLAFPLLKPQHIAFLRDCDHNM
jgi:hypothetical protein